MKDYISVACLPQPKKEKLKLYYIIFVSNLRTMPFRISSLEVHTQDINYLFYINATGLS